MTNVDLPKQPEQTATDETLEQAIAHQQLGEFQKAGELYLDILRAEPNHPQANHNMGVLAVQMKQPAASLSYFITALDADPTRGQYWLNYIDALIQAGDLDDARQVLALAQQQGLQGDEVDSLGERLKNSAQDTQHSATKPQHPPVDAADSLPISKSKSVNAHRSAPKHIAHKGRAPSQQDINALITLFSSGRLQEAIPVAQAMTERFPQHEFGWKALGAIFKQLGRSADALLPMQKAATLAPEDVESHYNLGVTFQELARLDEAKASYQQAIRINPSYAQAHSNLGVILQKRDRFEEAESCYRRALQLAPGNTKALSNLGVVLQKLGRLDEAEARYKESLQLAPDNSETHCNLGTMFKESGQKEEAEASFRRAIEINPDYADAHFNLGNLLDESSRLDEAAASYRRAIEINPKHAEAYYNLGNVTKQLDQLDAAEACYTKALEIKPDFAESQLNLGIVLSMQSKFSEAQESYQKALEIDRNYAEVYLNLGKLHVAQSQPLDAESSYKKALEIIPGYADANRLLGELYFHQNRLGESGVYYWQAIKAQPDNAEAYCSLAELLNVWGRYDEAEESLQKALKIKPDFAMAYSILGVTLKELGRLSEAEESSQRALELMPNDVTYCGLANVLQEQGRLHEAEVLFKQAIAYQPANNLAHNNHLFCISHNESTTPEKLFAEHLRYGEQFESPLKKDWPQHSNSRAPDRVLKIGFVSGDFKNHAVANFIEPVLMHLARCPQLSLHAYANHSIDDDTSKVLRCHFAHWDPILHLTDDELASKIQSDGIDILIDLSGHTAYNRLLAFARKPAPLQISWIGYPGTTGLRSIDYYLADRFLLPPGQFEGQFTEKIVRLPATGAFLPYKDAPPVSPLPSLKNGHLTFGSFNRLNKITRETIALWSQLLRSLPDSRLVFGGMPKEGKSNVLIDWFAHENISQDRLDFYPRSNMQDYLSLHQKIDICLDTFPYNGGTTTFHAIWMGVPTLSLSGKTAAGRSGAAILGNAGLEAFIAQNATDFEQKGASWSDKLTELSNIRKGLRKHFANSAAGRPELIADSLAHALRIMWQRWCKGLPAESFEVTRLEIKKASRGGKK